MKSVAEGAADVGVITMDSCREDLEYLPYHTDQLVVITPKDHILAKKKSVSFRETLDFDYVGLPVGSALNNRSSGPRKDLGRNPKKKTAFT